MTRAIRAVRFAADRYLALPTGALIALAWANSRPESYFAWAHALSFLVNDVAMVFFFALVTGEIIEATAPGGALHTWRRAALPVVGALGGIAGSALAYVGYLRMGDESSVLIRGWPIPCAADLAFGYFIVRNICRRHPAIPFFLLLGIASDILGLLIVELRYPTADRHPVGALLIAGAIASAIGLRHCRVVKVWPYILIGGALSWWGIFLSGLHPALALVPVMPFLPRRQARPAARRRCSGRCRRRPRPVRPVVAIPGATHPAVFRARQCRRGHPRIRHRDVGGGGRRAGRQAGRRSRRGRGGGDVGAASASPRGLEGIDGRRVHDVDWFYVRALLRHRRDSGRPDSGRGQARSAVDRLRLADRDGGGLRAWGWPLRERPGRRIGERRRPRRGVRFDRGHRLIEYRESGARTRKEGDS